MVRVAIFVLLVLPAIAAMVSTFSGCGGGERGGANPEVILRTEVVRASD